MEKALASGSSQKSKMVVNDTLVRHPSKDVAFHYKYQQSRRTFLGIAWLSNLAHALNNMRLRLTGAAPSDMM
jgi:hypothetical protein